MSSSSAYLARVLRGEPREGWRGLGQNLTAFLLSALGVVFFLGCSLGYVPDALGGVRVLWLGDGWAVSLLVLARPHRWTALLLGLVASETAVWTFVRPEVHFVQPLFFALLGAGQCAALAGLARRLVPALHHWRDQPITGLRYFVLALFVPAPFAALSAYVWIELGAGSSFLTDAQIWWLADALGVLLVPPLVYVFAFPAADLEPTRGARAFEGLLSIAILVVALVLVFGSPPGSPTTLLHLPFALFPPLAWAAVRCHPRVVNVVLLGTILAAFALTLEGRGPFGGPDVRPEVTAFQVQAFFVLLSLTVHALMVVAVDQRVLREDLRDSQRRYRSFVANSTEAIFRIDIDPPVPLGADRSVVVNQLIDRAVLEECNLAYVAALGESIRPPRERRPWHDDVFWFDLMLEHVDEAISNDFSLRGLEVPLRRSDDEVVDLLVSFSGVLEDGALRRIWGTATDVTRLHRAQRELEEQRTQLRRVTNEWIVAEDRARQIVAHEVSSGLVADLDALVAVQRELLDELGHGPLRERVRRVGGMAERAQRRCATILATFDPAGLGQEGLRRSLERLVAEIEDSDRRVHVQLRVGDWIERLPAPLAVLTYRLARELLDEAESQPHVRSARLAIDRPGGSLRIRFVEHGEPWRGDDPSARRVLTMQPRLDERIQALGGLLSIVPDPEGGFTTFTIEIPIGDVHGSHRKRAGGPGWAQATAPGRG